MLNKIKAVISKDLYKNADKLYRVGAVIFCIKISDDSYKFILCDKNKILKTIKFDGISRILDNIEKKNLSVYDVTSLIHFYSNNSVRRYEEKQKTSLKKELNLDREECSVPTAALKIVLKNSAMHASSSWETCIVSVTISYKNKSYIGSSNRLRQIRFDETKSNSVKLLDFYTSR